MNLTSYAVALDLMTPGDSPAYTLEQFAAPRPSWQALGACSGGDAVALFFIDRGGDIGPARALCDGCPVKGPCLDYALSDPGLMGMWGGTSDRERQRMRRQLADAA